MDRKIIYVVSDSTGETAERVTRAALLQFPDAKIRIRLERRVRDKRGLKAVLERASEQGAICLLYTSPSPRD